MKTQIPYNAGDYVQLCYEDWGSRAVKAGQRYVVMGHVWWPIERCNAYYMLPVNEYGEPTQDNPEYVWDKCVGEPSKFRYFTPKEQAA